MAEVLITSYVKECPSESNQLKYYLNLFKDLKSANFILRASIDNEIKTLESFTKSLSKSSSSFIKEMNSLTGNDTAFMTLCTDFASLFDSFRKVHTEKGAVLSTKLEKEVEDNNSALGSIILYLTDLNSASLKDLSNTRLKLKGMIAKRDKALKDFEYYVKKLDDNSIITDKAVNAFGEYNELAENCKSIYSEAKESEEYMEKCLVNSLINCVCYFVDYFHKIKNIFILLIKLKREFFEECNKLVSAYLEKILQKTISLTEFEAVYFKSNDIKVLTVEEMKALFKTNPESNDIYIFLDSLTTIITHRRNLIFLLYQFLTNVFKAYDAIALESKKKIKPYQFKAQFSPALESTFITKMLNFLFSFNELYTSKNAEFLKQNAFILTSLDGFIKELLNEEAQLIGLNNRLRKEVAVFKSNCSKGALKSDAIEESYTKFYKFVDEFLVNTSSVLSRFYDLTKAVDGLKLSSIDNVVRLIGKLFEFLFNYAKVSEAAITTEFLLEDNTKKVFGKMLLENKLNDNILDDIIAYSISFFNKDKYSLSQLPDICLIKQEERVLMTEMTLPNNLNEAQLKDLKEKNEKRPIKKALSYKKTELYTRQMTSDLRENGKVEEQIIKTALINNQLVLGFFLKQNGSYLFSSPCIKQPYSFDLEALELKSDRNCLLLNSNRNKLQLMLIHDKTTEQLHSNILQEKERYQKSNSMEELTEKQNEIFNVAPNTAITKEKLKEMLKKITQLSFEELNKKEILHKQFKEHYIKDQVLKCQVKVNAKETKELPIPIYQIFTTLYNPNYCSKVFPNFDKSFIRSLQAIRNEYDVIYTEPNFNLDAIPLFYTQKADETYTLLSLFPSKGIQNFIAECKLYPFLQEFNYTYNHPIPNPVFLGPKLLTIHDTYKFVFVSPTCFIVEIKSQSSGFMLLDSFYTVARYRFDSEFDDNLILCNTKINVEFTIEFVKENWFKNKVESNGYTENETYITTFVVPNMMKELEANGTELYSKFANDIAKLALIPSKPIEQKTMSNDKIAHKPKKRAKAKAYPRSQLYLMMIAAFPICLIVLRMINRFFGNNAALYLLIFVVITELAFLSLQLENQNKKNEG